MLDELSHVSKVGDVSDLVVILPDSEQNASSLMDKSVLIDTKMASSTRSEFAIYKDSMKPFVYC